VSHDILLYLYLLLVPCFCIKLAFKTVEFLCFLRNILCLSGCLLSQLLFSIESRTKSLFIKLHVLILRLKRKLGKRVGVLPFCNIISIYNIKIKE
jgi:hypothetical protein